MNGSRFDTRAAFFEVMRLMQDAEVLYRDAQHPDGSHGLAPAAEAVSHLLPTPCRTPCLPGCLNAGETCRRRSNGCATGARRRFRISPRCRLSSEGVRKRGGPAPPL